jgi:hypothetical protein
VVGTAPDEPFRFHSSYSVMLSCPEENFVTKIGGTEMIVFKIKEHCIIL